MAPNSQSDTTRVWRENPVFHSFIFCLFKMKPVSDSARPCGSEMRIIRAQACDACVIKQSGGVHTPSWWMKGSQGRISRPHVCAEYEACAENTCAPPGHTEGEH